MISIGSRASSSSPEREGVFKVGLRWVRWVEGIWSIFIYINATKAIFMKLRVLIILLFFTLPTSLFSQEKTTPLVDNEIMRNVSRMDIEGQEYENVKVTLKSMSPDSFSEKYRVKVTIVDTEGNEVWKKTLKGVFLYVFSDGQIQVGQPNFSKILIQKNYTGLYIGKIREKEGVY